MNKFLLILIFLLVTSTFLFAQNILDENYNPEYLDWLEHPYNYEVPPVAHVVPVEIEDTKTVLPERYLMMQSGYSTAVRNQKDIKMSWAFSAAAMAELAGCVKYSDTSLSFSPLNILNKNVYKDIYVSRTLEGNRDHYMSYFFNNIGPVNEADDPYKSPWTSPTTQPKKPGYVDCICILSNDYPNGFDENDINAVKDFVYNNGGVSVGLYFSDVYIDGNDENYYCTAHNSINHYVTIVGWDDNYSKKNFKSTPAGNGAFFCKDSYGTGRHWDGYFWVSYYDVTLSEATGALYSSASDARYNDILTHCKGVGTYSEDARYGFMYYYAPYKGKVTGLRTYVQSTASFIQYTLKKGDTVLETGTFKPNYPGFVSIDFSAYYSVAKGDLLSLRLDYNNSNMSKGNKVPLESRGYNYEPVITEGYNFVSSDGSNWTDCINLGRNLGAGILVKQEITPKTITLNDTDVNIEKGKTLELTATVKPDNAIYPSIEWVIKDSSIVKGETIGFGEKIKLTALKPGTTTITAYPVGYSNVYATCSVYVYQYVTGLSISPTSKTIKKGESFTITPTVEPEDATNQEVTWSSSKESVATVDSTGKVTGVSSGEATITCTTKESGYKATCKVTVTEDNVKVTGVTLDKTEMTMKKGANKVLTATVKPSNATNKEVTWSSSDKEVAYVNASGKVSAYKAGMATITVKTKDGGYKATCKVTVTQPVTGIKVSKTALTMVVADEVKITATVKPEDATNKDVTWSSSDTGVAKVNNGKITAKGKGKATITATSVDGGFKATCEVTVNKGVKVTGITLDRTTLTLNKGQAKILTPTITPSNATNQEVRWSSSNKSVAGVGSNGKVSAYAPGTTTITCTTRNGGLKATCKVTVVIPVTGVTLNKTTYEMSKGKTVTLKATVKPSEATNKKVTWKSSKTSVATVDSSGKVTAVAKGTATITVTTKDGSYKAICKITVK